MYFEFSDMVGDRDQNCAHARSKKCLRWVRPPLKMGAVLYVTKIR
jgi:hypothetical protein